MRLVCVALGQLPVAIEEVRIELAPLARGALVSHVEVPVVDQRLRRQQVVRLVAAVVRAVEGVEPERRGVDADEDEPEGQ